ncbi:MAG: O-methyltransferase [Gemmatimonadaceae bacterium]
MPSPLQTVWSAVDAYLVDRLIPADPVLDHALATSAAAGLPAISVTPTEGKLLYLLARLAGARRILEVGTLGAYSTIWLARALPPDGRLITLEISDANAAVARQNIAAAALSDGVEVWVAPAAISLARLIAERASPFDLIFIDADKENSLPYFEAALQLSRDGTVIVVDNVVRDGEVVQASSSSASVQGIRAFVESLAAEPRVEATAIQTVGGKGYDGFLVARVGGPVARRALG